MKWRHTKESENSSLPNPDVQKDSSRKLAKDNTKSSTDKTVLEDEEDVEIEVDVWDVEVYIEYR